MSDIHFHTAEPRTVRAAPLVKFWSRLRATRLPARTP